MIKVILVEDDKLVRKSLITSFDWEKFNMKIIGDAKNGEKALELLENHEVDLIITDLAMPIMSGIELIRKVKVLYPSIFIVVLSLHQDFEYIQEAMRLGAIDYIAKVELDTEHMDKTLERIHDRISAEQKKQLTPYHTLDDDILNGVVLISNKNIEEYSYIVNTSCYQDKWMFIGTEALIVFTENSEAFYDIFQILDSQTRINESLLLIEVENNTDYRREDIIGLIQRYREYFYFYEIDKDKKISVISFENLVIPQSDINLQHNKIKQIKEQLKSLKWVFDHTILENMLQELKALRLTNHKLKELLVINIGECQRLYSFILSKDIELADSYSCWDDVEKWFWDTQKLIYHSIYHKAISTETNASIFEAIYLIEKNLFKNLTTTEISNSVHMSRSYFCLCFKDVVGKTFNEYIQGARISKATHYLTYTNQTISVISEKVGYADAKYFSKVFRKTTGLLPSEYRKRYHKV